MAKIAIENIDDIQLNVLPLERRFDSVGDLAIHPLVKERYVNNGYNLAPKSRQEADARGQKHFNGLMSSFTRIHNYSDGKRNIVCVDIAPTRYLIGQARRDIVNTNKPDAETIEKLSPDMANVSLIAPIKLNGEYFLLSQIKGKALGSGQIHAGLVAGNIDAKYLRTENPLVAVLQNECSGELGINLSHLNSTSFVFMVDERETGQVNFAAIARNTDHQFVLSRYEADTKIKLAGEDKLEVQGLADLPIGVALVPLESGELKLREKVTCYKPTSTGLVETRETREVRPYTQGTLDYLKKNANFLLEKAGF